MNKPQSTQEYLESLEPLEKKHLNALLKIIRKAAPNAEELISYAMPAFKQKGMICWAAAAKNHVGFYTRPRVYIPFESQLKNYNRTKSALHLNYQDPIPTELIQALVKEAMRINEVNTTTKSTIKKKTTPKKATPRKK